MLRSPNLRRVFRALAAVLVATAPALAAPSNDRFLDRSPLSGPTGRVQATSVDATREPTEPLHFNTGGASVWWTWTPATDGDATIYTHGSDYDTVLAVYTGSSLTNLSLVADSDDASLAHTRSAVTFAAKSGVAYQIAVDGYDGQSGAISLTWYQQTTPNGRPLNDAFGARIQLDGEEGSVFGSTLRGSREPREPLHGNAPGTASSWWEWTAPGPGVAIFHTGGSSFSASIGVYTGDDFDSFVAIAGNAIPELNGYTFFSTTSDVTYAVAVDGASGETGVVELSWEWIPNCRPPSAPEHPFPPDETLGAGADVTLEWNRSVPLELDVIYGADDRKEYFQVDEPDLLAAADATAVVVWNESVRENGDGTATLLGGTFADEFDLCQDEPFRDQPVPGFCSAFLVAPDLVATAGHCVLDINECAEVSFVFGFRLEDAATVIRTVPESQVYRCAEIVSRDLDDESSDWAVIRLDRPVVGIEPLSIRRGGKVPSSEPLVLIGHPIGLPVKIAAGASVRENDDPLVFTANLDAYGGNSGSPVLSADSLLVEGILIEGEDDFDDVGCFRSKRCADDECSGETSIRTTAFAPVVPRLASSAVHGVFFGRCDEELTLVGTTAETKWNATDLEPDTAYCWRVSTSNACGSVDGPTWTFTTRSAEPRFRRGDANADGGFNIADAIGILNFLFGDGVDLPCPDAADATDANGVNIADGIFILNHLFGTGGPPLAPFEECGVDPTPDESSCPSFPPCG